MECSRISLSTSWRSTDLGACDYLQRFRVQIINEKSALSCTRNRCILSIAKGKANSNYACYIYMSDLTLGYTPKDNKLKI